jgi:LuxR family transcriptional regulator, maltose regulon positive regulatory protein
LPRAAAWERTVIGTQLSVPTKRMSSVARAPAQRARSAAHITASRARIAVEGGPRLAGASPGLVGRAGLVRRLSRRADASLVVIVAPPGYGKSMLLSAWERRDPRRFVWLSAAEPEVRHPRERCVLVLDDAHFAAPDLLRRAVDVAMTELPAGSTLALASRTEPALPLGRLRAQRRLVEVRADDLALTPAEATTLLRRSGLELDVGAVQTLVQRTEGWPAALYLASLSAHEQEDTASAVNHLRGDDHRLAEYFRDDVLSALSPGQLQFAVRTSVLDELSGPLCDTVLDQSGSGLMLRDLEQTSPLLHPIDPAHERYRWHGLVRESLQAELRRSECEMAPTLHLRASSWYLSRGGTDRAIDHAVAAHDRDRSGDMLWAAVMEYVSGGRNALVQRWLAEFTREELVGHPPLGLAAAYSFLFAGDLAQARHLAVAVTAATEREGDVAATSSLGAGLAGIEAMVAPAGVGRMAEAASCACRLEPIDGPRRPIYLFLHGTALYLSGERAAAEPLLDEAAELSAAPAPVVMSMCLAQAAMIAIERRDWDGAADLTDRARRVVEERGLVDYPVCALAFAASAAARARAGRADEAKQDLRRGIDLLTMLGDFVPWYGAEARILLAHASLWLADVVGARALLAEASRLARRAHGAVIFQQWFDDAWSYIDAFAEERLAGPSSLTIAELRILRFLPSHRSFREIAAHLGVSSNTVKTQAHAVYRKLGAASRSEAVGRATDAGLLGQ